MVRAVHDMFAKEWMKELLTDFGEVKVERPVSSEVRTIDLVFYPHQDRLESLTALGLLGKMLAHPCPIEFFRNAVPAQEIVNCRGKAEDLRSELRRLAESQKPPIRDRDLPFLWILSPTMSRTMRSDFCVVTKPEWGQGIYFLPKHDWTAVVAIHELPVTIDTLWLRLLGKGGVQSKAVTELLALPETHRYRLETLRHLAVLQVNLQMRQNKTKDLREVIMNLAPAYEQWYAKTIAEGEQRGEARGEARGEQVRSAQIAQRMLSKNMPLSEIAELTGLTIEQLKVLQAKA
jgi:hypothetical protein